MSLKPYANSSWSGSLKDGSGKVGTQSEVLSDTPYTFVSRINPSPANQFTNPEELLAAAHSSCYNMYLSLLISQKGYTITTLSCQANVKLTQAYDDLSVEEIQLEVTAVIAGISSEEFKELAEVAKFKCPISKALAVVPIILAKVELQEFN